jgi:hypothetical protein
MKTVQETWGVTEEKRFVIPGRYFRLISTSSPVDVEFFQGGRHLSEETAIGVEAGYFAIPPKGFSEFKIVSALGQTLKFAVTGGSGGYDRAQGDVDATIVRATALTNVAEASVGTSAASVLAANTSRMKIVFRALATNTADIALGAAALTLAAAAIRLGPGDVWIEETAAPAEFFAIAGAAAQKLDILTAA